MREHADLLKAVYHLEIQSLLDSWTRETREASGDYELDKMEKIVRDVLQYLIECSSAVKKCIEGNYDSRFFYRMRSPVQKITEINNYVAEFLRNASSIIELQHSDLVSLLQKATEQTVDTAKLITSLRTRCEIATTLIELRGDIFKEVKDELSWCSAQFSQLPNITMSFDLPREFKAKSLPDFLYDLSFLNKNFNGSLEIFFTKDEQSYRDKFMEINARLEPLQVSVALMKSKVADLHKTRVGFHQELKDIDRDFLSLVQECGMLAQGINELKSKTIDIRLVEVCDHVISRVLEIIDELTEEASAEVDELSIGSRFKTCSAAIKVIEKIVFSSPGESCLKKSILQYNLKVAPKWMRLNDILREHTVSVQTDSGNSALSETFHSMRTMKLNTPRAEKSQKRASYVGLGINLHLGVKPSPSVPYSVSKADRIVDLKLDSHSLSKSKHKMDFSQFDCEFPHPESASETRNAHEDQLSLPSTPALFAVHSPENTMDTNTTDTTPFYKGGSEKDIRAPKRLLMSPFALPNEKTSPRYLRKHDLGTSRIPKVVANHWQLKLPVLKKIRHLSHGPSKIPTISPDNEVFCSPERRVVVKIDENTDLGNIPTSKSSSREVASTVNLRSPPAFLIAHEKRAEKRQTDQNRRKFGTLGDVTNSLSRSPTVKVPARNLSLSGITTPNLAYSNETFVQVSSPVSWRSTSPERPGSSMGSRYDEANLMQPLKQVKKSWR